MKRIPWDIMILFDGCRTVGVVLTGFVFSGAVQQNKTKSRRC